MRRSVVAIAFLALLAGGLPAAHAAPPIPRILYAGDWSGSMQIFAADPTGRTRLGQVTFALPPGACTSAAACGYTRPLPSRTGAASTSAR